MTNKSIKFNAFLNGIRTILNLLFPLITFPYISRVLSVNEIGKYNFSNSIITYFLLIAALGIDKYAVREGAKYRENRSEMSKFASRVFSVNIVSTLISYIALIICLIFSTKLQNYLLCIVVLSLQIFFTTIGVEWIYTIYEDFSYITIRSIIFKIVSLILLFLFVRNEGDYLKYTAITVFASVASNIFNYVYLKKYCDLKLDFRFDWNSLIKPILVIFASNVAKQIYINSDVTMLGYLKGDYTVGIYSVSTKIYYIVESVVVSVLMVAIPRASLYVGKNMKKEYDELLKKLVNLLLIIVTPAVVGLIMIRKNVVLLIAGEKYLQSQQSLAILSLAIVCCVFSTFLGHCILLPYKMESVILKSTVISALLNISLNFILIPQIGEIGAALTTLISESVIVLMNYWGCRNIIKKIINKAFFENILSVTIGCIGLATACLLIDMWVSNYILKIILSIILAIIIYGVILRCLKNEYFLSFVNDLKNMMCKDK